MKNISNKNMYSCACKCSGYVYINAKGHEVGKCGKESVSILLVAFRCRRKDLLKFVWLICFWNIKYASAKCGFTANHVLTK